MKIIIFASIGAQNLGDELIVKNEIKILKEKYKSKNPRFIVFSYDPKNPFFEDDSVEYKEYFPISIKNPKNIFKNIKNFFVSLKEIISSDLIVIGGGGLFFDTEKGNKKNPLDLWLFRIIFFNFLLKKIYFFRVGLSIRKEESFLKIRKIFSGKRKQIEVRDNYSLKVLQDLGIEDVVKKYDPVFWDKHHPNPLLKGEGIEEILNKKISIKKILKDFDIKDLQTIDFKNKKIGIAFRRGYLTNNKNTELEILLVKEIIEYIQKSGAKVIFLPHSFSKQDILSNDYEWMKLIKNKLENIEITKSMQETYNMYKEKKVDIILAQRLHSIILSQVYEIPFVGINYSKKTLELLNELK